ncbi:MAG: UvrB/UvrC motif-containing protein, partial [Muribaculaceae bacterium]|nr:UvrB/UvrC motif-containing protein [Muribaculaceae bacterium]
VIMYADKITDSMQQTIEETDRRRELQMKYNSDHGITPQAIVKARNAIIGVDDSDDVEATGPRKQKSTQNNARDKKQQSRKEGKKYLYTEEFNAKPDVAADPVISYMNKEQLEKHIEQLRKQMVKAAKDMEFIEAARLRDEILKLEDKTKTR